MTIEALKDLGHRLIEEYMKFLPNERGKNSKSKRERTYEDLEKSMKGKNSHFGEMREKNEVMLAIGTLKKMIVRKNYERLRTKTINRAAPSYSGID